MRRHVFVPGTPKPQGSHKYVGHRGGRPVLAESSKGVSAWRETIRRAARTAGGMLPPGPVSVRVEFVMPRPQRCPLPTPPAIKRNGDLDKLTRAVFDALTGAWIGDDSLITHAEQDKRTAEPGEAPGVTITVTALSDSEEATAP